MWVTTATAPKLGRVIRRATLAGLALSTSVEALQTFSQLRRASILDVATNTAGAFVGAFGAALLIAATVRARGGRSYLGVPAFLGAGAYIVAIVCEAATPLFRSEPDRTVTGDPLTRLRVLLDWSLPIQLWQIPWLDIPLYVPAGFLAVMLLHELGHDERRVWPLVAAGGVLLAVALEVGHGAAGISIRWEAAFTHVVALGTGAWAARMWLPRWSRRWLGAARARVAMGAYALLLVLWAWRPLLPRTSLSELKSQLALSQFIPLASVAVRADVFSAMHVVQQFFLYLPLGVLLAVWPLREAGRWARLRPALLFALVLEAGHLVIAERLFDLTNVLLAWAGILWGWTVVRRAGFTPYGEALTTR